MSEVLSVAHGFYCLAVQAQWSSEQEPSRCDERRRSSYVVVLLDVPVEFSQGRLAGYLAGGPLKETSASPVSPPSASLASLIHRDDVYNPWGHREMITQMVSVCKIDLCTQLRTAINVLLITLRSSVQDEMLRGRKIGYMGKNSRESKRTCRQWVVNVHGFRHICPKERQRTSTSCPRPGRIRGRISCALSMLGLRPCRCILFALLAVM